MGDALQRVLNGVGEVVHGIDAPLVPLAVMVQVVDPVEHRVPHIEVAAGQVDLGPQGVLALGELAVLHPLEQVQALLDGPVPPGGAGGSGDISPVLLELLRRQLADIGQALLDEAPPPRRYILVKVIGAVEEPVAPVKAQPVDVLLDGVYDTPRPPWWGSCHPSAGCTGRRTSPPCRSRWSAPCSGRCAGSRWAPAGTGCGRSSPRTGRPGPMSSSMKAWIKFRLSGASSCVSLISSAMRCHSSLSRSVSLVCVHVRIFIIQNLTGKCNTLF